MPPKGSRKSQERRPPSEGTLNEDNGTSQGYANTDSAVSSYSLDDLLLPKSLVLRIAKEALPEGTTIPSDGQLALQRSASVFISYLCSEANLIARDSLRKTITPNDVLKALDEIELSSFAPTVRESIGNYESYIAQKKLMKQQQDQPTSALPEDEILEDDKIISISANGEPSDADHLTKKRKGRKAGTGSSLASSIVSKSKSRLIDELKQNKKDDKPPAKRGRRKKENGDDKVKEPKEKKKPGRKRKVDTEEESGDKASSSKAKTPKKRGPKPKQSKTDDPITTKESKSPESNDEYASKNKDTNEKLADTKKSNQTSGDENTQSGNATTEEETGEEEEEEEEETGEDTDDNKDSSSESESEDESAFLKTRDETGDDDGDDEEDDDDDDEEDSEHGESNAFPEREQEEEDSGVGSDSEDSNTEMDKEERLGSKFMIKR